jgi:hypothetical protein
MCDCMDEVNAKLAERNTKIELPWFGPQLPRVITMKLDDKKRGKPMGMFCTFCPFCGEKYQANEDREPVAIEAASLG